MTRTHGEFVCKNDTITFCRDLLIRRLDDARCKMRICPLIIGGIYFVSLLRNCQIFRLYNNYKVG